jgi:hypothetical protein
MIDEEIIKWIIGGNFGINALLGITCFLLKRALEKKDKELQASHKARINDAKATSNLLSKIKIKEDESESPT